MLIIGIHGVKDRALSDGTSSFISHDHAVAFSRNGKIISSIELERYTGIKHDNRLEEYIAEVIHRVWDGLEKLRFVLVNSFIGDSFSSSDSTLIINSPGSFKLEEQFKETTGQFLSHGKKVDADFFIITHELAHVATCLPFFGSFKPSSLLVHIDGGASQSCHSSWYYDGSELRLTDHGWDQTKMAVNNFNDNPLAAWILGLELKDHLSIPGKLMGLAAWGKLDPELYAWLVENGWFQGFEGGQQDLVGHIPSHFSYKKIQFDPAHPFCKNVAFAMQQYFEDTIISFILKEKSKVNAKHIYYSGGAALNIISNTRLEKQLQNVDLFIPPAPSDCGLALGAAAFFDWKEKHKYSIHSPYLNNIYLEDHQLKKCNIKDAVDSLVEGKVIAFVHGDGETGPRALGHRSFLIRPDSISLRQKLSEAIKAREWFRPVAPVLLQEQAKLCLVDFDPESNLAQFMLGCWKVKPGYENLLAGSIHADKTVRAQVIGPNQKENGPLVTVLNRLWRDHNIWGLINTSLNVKGKPILQSLTQSVVDELLYQGVDRVLHIQEDYNEKEN